MINREYIILADKENNISILNKMTGDLYAYPNGYVQNVADKYYGNNMWNNGQLPYIRRQLKRAVTYYIFHNSVRRIRHDRLTAEHAEFYKQITNKL